MTGSEMEALRDAVCDALAPDDLDQLLRLRLNRTRAAIAGDAPHPTVVFRVIEAASRGGWISDFVQAAIDYTPGNDALRRFYSAHQHLITRSPTPAATNGTPPSPPPVAGRLHGFGETRHEAPVQKLAIEPEGADHPQASHGSQGGTLVVEDTFTVGITLHRDMRSFTQEERDRLLETLGGILRLRPGQKVVLQQPNGGGS